MTVCWTPSSKQIAAAQMTAFAQQASQLSGQALQKYSDLHDWSINEREAFWGLVWERAPIIAAERGDIVLVDGDKMPGAKWFPQARLNFAENLLRHADDREALVFRGEDRVKQRYTRRALYGAVAKLAAALRGFGVGPGDRVAAYMPNLPETIIAMLAATSLGAIWSSCSPDFGVNGVVDRFKQIEPKILIAADGVFYNGKSFDNVDKIDAIRHKIPTIEQTILVPYTKNAEQLTVGEGLHLWPDMLAQQSETSVDFAQLPFDHPLYILFSSGTTGIPKCIVHGAGGTLLQHMKEHQLHSDIRAGDRVFYFTTCGWMMWNWLVSALASEAVVMLYDGSPFYPDGNVLWDYAAAEKITLFGTSAKYIDALQKAALSPGTTHELSAQRCICSTGSPLSPASYDYVYEHIKADVNLASISGGTDIVSCFALGNPVLPVHKGELQCRGLGLAVEVFDDQGQCAGSEKGELVCTKPFPSMPVGFWNDPSGEKYFDAYFGRFDNIWCHGDYVRLTERGGLVIYGRSDAVLNPGGVRIGTAEIYRQVEQLDEVMESIVIAQQYKEDVRLVLFVILRDAVSLDDALVDKIKGQIRANTSPRHVPEIILQVSDIPRTKSGKIVELAVRDVVHGIEIKNVEALANPRALQEFTDRAELKL
ncbi:MAG: acetoacetate--CoA ligase [bacterium]|nr:acetoacetate--CoA ligase [bacterium]